MMKRSVTTWVVTCTPDSSGEMSNSEPGLIFLYYFFLSALNCGPLLSPSLLLCLSSCPSSQKVEISHDTLPSVCVKKTRYVAQDILIMLQKSSSCAVLQYAALLCSVKCQYLRCDPLCNVCRLPKCRVTMCPYLEYRLKWCKPVTL